MGNGDIVTFPSGLSKSWFPFSERGFYQEEFIVGVFILALLESYMEEFIDFGFLVSVWNFDFVGGHIKSSFFVSFYSYVVWNPAY